MSSSPFCGMTETCCFRFHVSAGLGCLCVTDGLLLCRQTSAVMWSLISTTARWKNDPVCVCVRFRPKTKRTHTHCAPALICTRSVNDFLLEMTWKSQPALCRLFDMNKCFLKLSEEGAANREPLASLCACNDFYFHLILLYSKGCKSMQYFHRIFSYLNCRKMKQVKKLWDATIHITVVLMSEFLVLCISLELSELSTALWFNIHKLLMWKVHFILLLILILNLFSKALPYSPAGMCYRSNCGLFYCGV